MSMKNSNPVYEFNTFQIFFLRDVFQDDEIDVEYWPRLNVDSINDTRTNWILLRRLHGSNICLHRKYLRIFCTYHHINAYLQPGSSRQYGHSPSL
jgi:hypothetical protein